MLLLTVDMLNYDYDFDYVSLMFNWPGVLDKAKLIYTLTDISRSSQSSRITGRMVTRSTMVASFCIYMFFYMCLLFALAVRSLPVCSCCFGTEVSADHGRLGNAVLSMT